MVKAAPLSPTSPLAIFLFFSALSVVWTWPLGAHLSSRIPHDPGDPILNTYLLWWNAATVPFSSHWWNPPFFFPLPGALALSEHLAGLSIISTPVQLLGGGAVLAYNLSLLASYALSAWFAYLLVHRLTGSAPAAVCAGLAYGFAPFRAAQLAHLQVLTSQWLPLHLLAMHAYLDDGRRRWLVVSAVAWLLQGLSNGYYLLFAPVLVALWLAWFPRWRRPARRELTLAGVWMLAMLPFVPILMKYREVHQALGLSRGVDEIVDFSATPASFLNPPRLLAFWPPRTLYAREDDLFPGVTIVALILAGAIVCVARGRWRATIRQRSPLAFYAAAAVLLATLTFGPGDPEAGASRWVRPYFWLALLPGFDALRVPARFAMLSTLCAAVAAGVAVSRILPARRAARLLFLATVATGLAVDGWMEPMPLVVAPGRQFLSDIPPNAAILEVPPDEKLVNLTAMYRALLHRRPLINGYSGHFPPHYVILMHAVRGGDPTPIIELARGRPLAVIVNDQFDPSHEFRDLIESLPGVTRTGRGNAGTLYLIPAQPRERVDASGASIPAIAAVLPRAHLLLDLGRPQVVRTIEFPLRASYSEFPRIAIETSSDGRTWETAWENWIGGRALVGALEDPRSVPVRIPLADVETRYLRIHPLAEWMIGELRVVGP